MFKTIRLLGYLLLLYTPWSGAATLTIDGIPGDGYVTVTLSGTSIAEGNFNLGSHNTVLWHDIGDYTGTNNTLFAFLPGSTLSLSSLGGTLAFDELYIDDDDLGALDDIGFGAGTETGDLRFNTGDMLTWSGNGIANVDIAALSMAGIPWAITALNDISGQGNLGIEFTSPPTPVPLPSSIQLFVGALLMLLLSKYGFSPTNWSNRSLRSLGHLVLRGNLRMTSP
ncbi:MAG: hypothetical protein ABW170_23115 [Candidatus Thiodiazotropha sp. L084R]